MKKNIFTAYLLVISALMLVCVGIVCSELAAFRRTGEFTILPELNLLTVTHRDHSMENLQATTARLLELPLDECYDWQHQLVGLAPFLAVVNMLMCIMLKIFRIGLPKPVVISTIIMGIIALAMIIALRVFSDSVYGGITVRGCHPLYWPSMWGSVWDDLTKVPGVPIWKVW